MTQANNVAIESSQINSSGVLQPAGGGTGVTTSTGSGSVVLSTSPTLVTPVLGTPTSGTLTNCTGYTYANLSGTVPTWNQNTTGTAGGLTGTPNITVGTIGATSGTFSSTISASNFSGSSSGTNTGDQTNISGNAATVSSITGNTGLIVNNLYAPGSSGLVDGLTTTNFRSQMFGSTTNSWALSAGRWNSTPAPFSGLSSYGTVISWAGSDTQGFLAMNYNSAGAIIGGGNGNNINWTATLLTSANYTSYSPSLTGSGASGTWGIAISGNAATATSATSATYLNSSNYINQTGSTGTWNSDFQNTPAGTARYNGDVGANTSSNPGGTWWIQQNFRHTNSSNYWGTQVAWGWEDNANKLATRNVSGGTFGSWVYYLNSSNYTSYAARAQSYSGTLTAANGTTWSHGLGSTPKQFGIYWICTSAVSGYSVGDLIAMSSSDGDGGRQFAVSANASTVGIYGSMPIIGGPSGSINIGSGQFGVIFWASL